MLANLFGYPKKPPSGIKPSFVRSGPRFCDAQESIPSHTQRTQKQINNSNQQWASLSPPPFFDTGSGSTPRGSKLHSLFGIYPTHMWSYFKRQVAPPTTAFETPPPGERETRSLDLDESADLDDGPHCLEPDRGVGCERSCGDNPRVTPRTHLWLQRHARSNYTRPLTRTAAAATNLTPAPRRRPHAPRGASTGDHGTISASHRFFSPACRRQVDPPGGVHRRKNPCAQLRCSFFGMMAKKVLGGCCFGA